MTDFNQIDAVVSAMEAELSDRDLKVVSDAYGRLLEGDEVSLFDLTTIQAVWLSRVVDATGLWGWEE